MKKTKQHPNFQDLYPFEDYLKTYQAKKTFDCGLSPVCLLAPDHYWTVHQDVINGRNTCSAALTIRTLKLEYAIQVWVRAALISSGRHNDIEYYWWLNYEDNETSFRELKYSYHPYNNYTPKELNAAFWKLLEEIANSGEVKVHEGYSYENHTDTSNNNANISFTVALNIDSISDEHRYIRDIFTQDYDTTPRSFSWEEISPLFTELTLKQLSLTDPKRLHKHTDLDESLMQACSDLDIDIVKALVEKGADVNALNEHGESALQRAIKYFTYRGMDFGRNYTEEDRQRFKAVNYEKCVAIVDYLLDHGADIDLFGVGGMQPLTCAYYTHSVEMVKHLLEKGSDPNYNSYRDDDVLFEQKETTRCTVLQVIYDDIYEDYDDVEKEIEQLVHSYGGRRLSWDYCPENNEHLGKYYILIRPDYEKWLFSDNCWWGIGDETKLTVEDADGNQTEIVLPKIAGLKEWHQEYGANIETDGFDWNEWNQRGVEFSHKIADILPATVALFYPYSGPITVMWDDIDKRHYLSSQGKHIRIK